MENISFKSVLKFTAVIVVVYFFHFVPVGSCDTLIMDNNNVEVKSKPVVIAAGNSVIMKTHLKTGKIKITKKDK